ncbi:MAG: iron complex transport system ATP-binding protein [Paracoccaceae bacterium]|jgi:iron complex transport system ATP-binding protein
MFELRNVSLTRGKQRVLGPLDMDIRPGELLAVIGANGAGKSSLLSLLCGLLEPDAGGIRFAGRALTNNSRDIESLARQRALMPQFHALGFDFTVREVVTLGRNPHHRHCTSQDHTRYIEQAMALGDVTALAKASYTRLSGGQQARVQFARVLAQLNCGEGDGKFLLLDEPTASLDLRHQRDVMSCVRALTERGLGCVAVLHDINLAARFAHRIAIFDAGKLLAIGPPESVLTEPLLKRAFGIDVRVFENILPNQRLVAI